MMLVCGLYLVLVILLSGAMIHQKIQYLNKSLFGIVFEFYENAPEPDLPYNYG